MALKEALQKATPQPMPQPKATPLKETPPKEALPKGAPPKEAPPSKEALSGIKIFLLCAYAASALAAPLLLTTLDFKLTELVSISLLWRLLALALNPNTLLFVAMLTLATIFATLFGFKLTLVKATLTLTILLPGFLLGLTLPSIDLIAPAIVGATATASLLASRKEHLGIGASWGIASKVALLLVALAFLIVLLKAMPFKEAYFDAFINSTMGILPGVSAAAPQAIGSALMSVVERLEINESLLQVVATRESVASMLAAQYDSMANALRETLAAGVGGVNVTIPSFAELPIDRREAMINETLSRMVARAREEASAAKERIRAALNATIQEIARRAAPMAPAFEEVKRSVLDMLRGAGLLQPIYDAMAFFVAFAAALVTWLVCWPIKVVATLITWLIAKFF